MKEEKYTLPSQKDWKEFEDYESRILEKAKELESNKLLRTDLIIAGIISSIIGGLVVYYLLRSKTTTTLSSQSTTLIESRLDSIEHRLQQIQQLQFPQQSSQQTLQPQPLQAQPSQPSLNNTSYKNNEIRKYIRDAKGRITSTEIIRNAKIS